MRTGSSTRPNLGNPSDPPLSSLDPVIISLLVLLVSALIHFIPQDLRRRLRDSWDIFWPPWQLREGVRGADKRVGKEPEKSSRQSGREEGAGRAAAHGRSGSSSAAAAKHSGPIRDEKDFIRVKETSAGTAIASQRIRINGVKSATGPSDTNTPPPKEVAAYDNANKSARPVAIESKSAKLSEPKSQSERAQEAKNPSTNVPSDPNENGRPESNPDDPLMAGDYRPLRSILKKSKKKPHQSKNTHHNYFMAMRGNRAHLIPFPHGLHPPPSQPRHTLWWNNIPKNADHMMAPPPVPKAVKDVLAGEDPEEVTKKTEVVVSNESSRGTGVKVVEEKTGQAEAAAKEKERARLKAKMEADQKAKISSTERPPGTASASVSIEPAKQPNVPVDPQVQKTTWASQAILCLLLFYIHQQLGLVLMAFFVWQQLNTMSEIDITTQAPTATATARAAAPPIPEPVLKVPRREEIPPEMKEKLARAKMEKESRASSESRMNTVLTDPARIRSDPTSDKGKGKEVEKTSKSSEDQMNTPMVPHPTAPQPTSSSKPDKGKGKEVMTDPQLSKQPKAAPTQSVPPNLSTKPRALSPEERAAYRARLKHNVAGRDVKG